MPNAISHEKCSYKNINDASIQIIGLFMMKCITKVCAIKKKTNIIKCDICYVIVAALKALEINTY